MTNKELVAAFIEAMRISDVAALTGMIADDFSWWIAGKPEYLQTAGAHYDNSYHFLFTIADGKITRMKEYMDTYHAKTTFGL
ncbi:MAG: hypothetical protein KUG62_10430 [Rhodobacteraceae bacterium]|nr:hypothetical protein [Paracoccaceae bacterium]